MRSQAGFPDFACAIASSQRVADERLHFLNSQCCLNLNPVAAVAIVVGVCKLTVQRSVDFALFVVRHCAQFTIAFTFRLI